MFRAAPVSEPVPVVEPCAHPVPLAELERDLGGVPAEGWALHLGKKGVAIIPDDLGRDSISRSHARLLLDEARELAVKQAKQRAMQELELVEADQRRRSQIWRGIPADELPVGVSAGDAMAEAARASLPRRQSMVEAMLGGDNGTVFHSYQPQDEAS